MGIEHFCNGMTHGSKTLVDALTSGSLLKKTMNEANTHILLRSMGH